MSQFEKAVVRLAEALIGEDQVERPGEIMTTPEAVERIQRVADRILARKKDEGSTMEWPPHILPGDLADDED